MGWISLKKSLFSRILPSVFLAVPWIKCELCISNMGKQTPGSKTFQAINRGTESQSTSGKWAFLKRNFTAFLLFIVVRNSPTELAGGQTAGLTEDLRHHISA